MPDDLLARLGFREGKAMRWCAACERTFPGAPQSFKCRPCAQKDAWGVRRDELKSEDAWKPPAQR